MKAIPVMFVPCCRNIVVVLIMVLGSSPAWAQPGPQGRAARVIRAGGTVQMRRGAATEWAPVRSGGELLRGDVVRTQTASFARLSFDVGGEWTLAEGSELNLTPAVTDGPGRITVKLERGGAVAKWRPVTGEGQAARLTVATPSGRAGIVGTEWSLRVADDGTSTLLVLDGRVDFGNEAGSVSVGANEAAEMAIGRKPELLRLVNPDDRVQWVSAYQPNPARYAAGRDASANAALIEVDALMGAGDFPAAHTRLEGATPRFPSDARFDALRSRLALFEGDSAVVRSAADAAVAKDPQAVEGWLALGDAGIREGDLAVAQRGFTEAGRVAPQDGRAWFGLGTVASDHEDFPNARRFLTTALRLEPDGPGYRGQLGLTYTLANAFKAAAREYAAALEQQPEDYVSLTGRALLALKQGRETEAVELLQRVTLFEPRYARAHMYLGVAYYRQRRVDAAIRELERATENDVRDPLPYMMLTQVYTDLFEPWKAIQAARAAQERMPYLKSFNQLSNTVKGGANLGNSLAFFGLEEWAMGLAQQSYDPLWAGSHLFLGDRYLSEFARFSEYFQGLLTDPTAFGGSTRFQTLLSRPGTYVTAGTIRSGQQKFGERVWNPVLAVNGLSTRGRPVSYFLTGDRVMRRAGIVKNDAPSWSAALGTDLSPGFKLLALASHGHQHDYVTTSDDGLEFDRDRIDLGGSVRTSPTRMWWFKAAETDAAVKISLFGTGLAVRSRTYEAQVRHTWTSVVGLELSTGAEVAWLTDRSRTLTNSAPPFNASTRSTLTYLSSRKRLGNVGLIQGDLFVSRGQNIESQVVSVPHTTVLPRLGLALSAGAGRVVRISYQKWEPARAVSTLAPVATAGLPLDNIFIGVGGLLQSVRAQLDWPVSARSFIGAFITRNERQPSQRHAPGWKAPLNLDRIRNVSRDASRLSAAGDSVLPGLGIAVYDYDSARATTAGVSINRVVTSFLSVYARYQARSSVAFDLHTVCAGLRPDGSSGEHSCARGAVPFYPTHSGALGWTFVSPSRIYADVQFVRRGPYSWAWPAPASDTTTDSGFKLSASWESPDKSWSVEATASNVFESVERIGAPNERLKYTFGGKYRW